MNEHSGPRPVLILGIGNILLRDEGVGVRVIEHLLRRTLPNTIEVLDGGTCGADLIDVLADRRKVIVVDAIQSDGAPGTVVRFEQGDLERSTDAGLSLHELGIAETLAMTDNLNCRPQEVVFFGIVPRDISPGLELSDEIADVVAIAADKVAEEALAGLEEGGKL